LDSQSELGEFKGLEADFSQISLVHSEKTQTEEGIEARQAFFDYNNLTRQRLSNKGFQISEATMEEIETNRDLFASMAEFDKEEIGELFDMPEEIIEYEKEMSDSSSSSDSDEITWFQLVPSTSLIEGAYNFDNRCRQAMLSANDFIFKIFVDKDVEEMVRNKEDLANIMKLINYVSLIKKQLKLTKQQKSIIKSLIYSLKNIIKKNNNTYHSFTTNISLKWKENKVKFFAMKGFESEETARNIAKNRPTVTIARDTLNCASDITWLATPLFQDDLDDFLSKGFTTESFHRNTQFASLLSQFIPRLEKTDFGLKGKYDF
jgi:hypothetical protein